MRTLSIEITEKLSGRTVLSILKNELNISGTLIKRMKRCGGIRIFDEPVHVDRRVIEHEILYADIDTGCDASVLLPFPILFEDEDMLVIDKPANLAVHGRMNSPTDENLSDIMASYVGAGHYHPVNRLDRCTSGAMVIAKNGHMHKLLIELLHTEKFKRIYLALICGIPSERVACIELPIARDTGSPIKRMISQNGKYAKTCYEIIKSKADISLVKVQLYTGRTHQIRLHFSAIGYPLLGDFLYGNESDIIMRCALHSHQIQLLHPLTNEILCINADMPDDMKSIIE
ncbi:MAG: RluA family pseudouridine synthase [Clostridia bacterium]|nr:RluA family pseudouridine synthase [Clostridia bacterium]